ncbi:MAG TPA: glycosyl hydrolase family 28-related protein, partial [Pirellulaceae bacterium]|nr:glycosyl hydrolase family 28-related protein [Pirellulaceae bacterium]
MSDVRDFGAVGDGKHDDTAAVLHAVADGDGVLHFPPGNYLLSKTIELPLAKVGRVAIDGSGGTAKILMGGAGPAFRIVGSHEKNALPAAFLPGVWQRERLPTVRDIEIEGVHPEASGILLEGTMQATITGVLLRELHDGIRVLGRCRNLLISHCPIYHLRNI